MSTPVKHESTTQPGLFFWAEEIWVPGGVGSPVFCVTSQATGFPATEGFDDWFANLEDADQIAQKLAKGIL